MDKYRETFETWNKLADLYQDKFMDLDLYNETYDFFCDLLGNEKSSILELGCGPGNITRYLLSKKPYLNILATDSSPNMIELAKKNNPSASFSVMDCRSLDQMKSKFNALVCGFCLPYLSPYNCEKLINDSFNILNENGLLYISFVEGDSKKSGFQSGSSGDRIYFYYHSIDAVTGYLDKNNFEVIRTFKLPYSTSNNEIDQHIIIIAKKLLTKK